MVRGIVTSNSADQVACSTASGTAAIIGVGSGATRAISVIMIDGLG